MNSMQLEFNFDEENEIYFKMCQMQKQINEINESTGKVRKKLFSEIGELKKICQILQIENEILKNSLREFKNEKTNWIYGKGNNLFDVPGYSK